MPNYSPPDPDTPHEDPLISDLIDTEEDSDYTLGPDKLGFYTFFMKGEGCTIPVPVIVLYLYYTLYQ